LTDKGNIIDREIDLFYEKLAREASSAGYHQNPDTEFTKSLIAGLIENEKRYGYASCPCRLAAKNKEGYLDIICPCDYRDPDLAEHGSCYCGLYVSEAVMKSEKKLSPIPERRLSPEERAKISVSPRAKIEALPIPCGGAKSVVIYVPEMCRPISALYVRQKRNVLNDLSEMDTIDRALLNKIQKNFPHRKTLRGYRKTCRDKRGRGP
jgi:ferredoxin-thioredoxin reductase catalytic subunit